MPDMTTLPGPGPGSLTWRHFGDARGLLFVVRAGVLQAMHPAIDAALRQHSDFFENPWNRLLRSSGPILGVIYDRAERTGETANWIRDQHKGIKGETASGAKYHALNPDAFYWAHATFFESIIAVQACLGNPLSRYAQERLYDESIGWYEMYGLTMRPVPADYAAFERYWREMLNEGLEATEVAVGTFKGTMNVPSPYPMLNGLPWLVMKPFVTSTPTFVARGTLPPEARRTLGLEWTARDELALRGILAPLRYGWPLVPERAKWHPRAWKGVSRSLRQTSPRPSAVASGLRSTA
jgi:uncharacterized protein (DUF2236 family)